MTMDVNELETIVINLEFKADRAKKEMLAAAGNLDLYNKKSKELDKIQDKLKGTLEGVVRTIVNKNKLDSENIENEIELLKLAKQKGTYVENYTRQISTLTDALNKAKAAEKGGIGVGLSKMFGEVGGTGLSRGLSVAALQFKAVMKAHEIGTYIGGAIAHQKFGGQELDELRHPTAALDAQVARQKEFQSSREDADVSMHSSVEKRMEERQKRIARLKQEADTAAGHVRTSQEAVNKITAFHEARSAEEQAMFRGGSDTNWLVKLFGSGNTETLVPGNKMAELKHEQLKEDQESHLQAQKKLDEANQAQNKDRDERAREAVGTAESLTKQLEEQAKAYGDVGHAAQIAKLEKQASMATDKYVIAEAKAAIEALKKAAADDLKAKGKFHIKKMRDTLGQVEMTPGQKAADEARISGFTTEQQKASKNITEETISKQTAKAIKEQGEAYGKTAHEARILHAVNQGLRGNDLRRVKDASLIAQRQEGEAQLKKMREHGNQVFMSPGEKAADDMRIAGHGEHAAEASKIATQTHTDQIIKSLQDQARAYGKTRHEVTMLQAENDKLNAVQLKAVEIQSKQTDFENATQDIKNMTEQMEEQKKAILDSSYVLAPYLKLLKQFHDPKDKAKAEEQIKKNVLGQKGAELEKEMRNPKEQHEERMKELNAIYEASGKTDKDRETFSRAANAANKKLRGPSSSSGVKEIEAGSVEAMDFIQKAHDQMMDSRKILPDSEQKPTPPPKLSPHQIAQAEKARKKAEAKQAWADGIALRKGGQLWLHGQDRKNRLGNRFPENQEDINVGRAASLGGMGGGVGGDDSEKDKPLEENTQAIKDMIAAIQEMFGPGATIDLQAANLAGVI